MYLLAIETSCDETAVAVASYDDQGHFAIVAETISSQVDLHALYGGVVPELAAREHLSNLPILVEQVLLQAKIDFDKLSCLAATRGPGLKGCLLIGLDFVKGIALARDLPWIGVNHIEGHALAPFIDNPNLSYPYLCLVVSGGHTEIHKVIGLGKYELIARTTDDAAGEAFDKSAHLLGFPYPGGAQLAKLADTATSSSFNLPKVMRHDQAFSFSGLKTAISLLIAKNKERISADPAIKAGLAFAIQAAIVEALVFKVKVAIEQTGIKKVAVTGGVAANRKLRAELAAISGIEFFCPSAQHCTDNAAMIAYVAAKRIITSERANFTDTAIARWPIETLGVSK